MSVVMFMELPGATTAQYDELNDLMGIHGPDDEPEGLLSHVCAKTADGLLICDVWRSQADLDDFVSTRVGPAMEKVGAPAAPPQLGELHHQFAR